MASASDRLDFRNLFASPLVMRQWGDDPLNAELRERILEHRDRSGGVGQSNNGGWHSEYGRLEFCGRAGIQLLDRAIAFTHEATDRVLQDQGRPPERFTWTFNAWANVNGPGHFNQVHTHPGSTWSGVYYVDMGVAGSAAPAAALQILDPCQGRANTFLPNHVLNNVTLRPEAGLMLMFPSYVGHMVFPHEGPGPRISIAFNVRREPYP
jgi:uncharacterized protein (TIGR02466 family)